MRKSFLRCRRRSAVVEVLVSLLLLAMVAVLCLASNTVPVQAGSARIPTIERKYPHIACTACLSFAEYLAERMEKSLEKNDASVLTSHRLDEGNKLKRKSYRTSEVRVVDVLDNICHEVTTRYLFRHDSVLRIRRFVDDKYRLTAAPPSIWALKDEAYSDEIEKNYSAKDAKIPRIFRGSIDGDENRKRFELAKFYGVNDKNEIRDETKWAVRNICDYLVNEQEEAVEEIIKTMDSVEDVKDKLCGYPSVILKARRAEAEEEGEDENAANGGKPAKKKTKQPKLPSSLLPYCSNFNAMLKSEVRDIKLWKQWTRRRIEKAIARGETAEDAARAAAEEEQWNEAASTPSEETAPESKEDAAPQEAENEKDDASGGDL